MSALIVTISGSSGDFVHRVLGGALAGFVVPATVVSEAPPSELLEVEAVVPEVLATRFAGDSCAAQIAALAQRGPVLAWCAVAASLPKPGGGVISDAWLRFAVGLGTAREKLVPLATLRVKDGRMVLRFGMHGAPIVPPPSRDAGGPIDQAWKRASDEARASMGRALARIEGGSVSLGGEGIAPEVLSDLGRAWNVAVTPDDAAPSTLAIPSVSPGKCLACRHANQGTDDLVKERLLACAIAGPRPIHLDPICDVVWPIDGKKWFAFEPFDGGNSTWGYLGDVRIKLPLPPKK